MPTKAKKNVKNMRSVFMVIALATLSVFAIFAVKMINQESLDTRSDASGGSAQLGSLAIYNGPFPNPPQHRPIQSGSTTYLDSGNFRIDAPNYTSGWERVVVAKVNDIEKIRRPIIYPVAEHYISYSGIQNELRAQRGDRIAIFVNLKKTVGNTVYTCKYDSTMWQNPLGRPQEQVRVTDGSTCVNQGVKMFTLQ